MIRATQSYKAFKAFLLATALVVSIGFMSGIQPQALATPLTPEAAKYEIDQAHSPEDVRARLEKRTKQYNQGKGNSFDDSKVAQSRVARETKKSFKTATENVRETLDPKKSIPEKAKTFLNNLKGES